MDGTPKKTAPKPRTSKKETPSPPRSQSSKQSRGGALQLIEDIGALVVRSQDLKQTLQEVTQTIAQRMGTNVCSLYLLGAKK
jgi:hypothetical protein